MEYNNNQGWQPSGGPMPQGSYPQIPRKPAGSGFATASLLFAVIALISALTMTLIFPFFFGSLSIILGLLSRGSQKKLHSNALAGIVVAASALVINVAVCIFSFYTVFSDPAAREQYWSMVDQTYEQLTGMDFDEILESYGIDPSLIRQ